MNVYFFVPYAILYHTTNSDETLRGSPALPIIHPKSQTLGLRLLDFKIILFGFHGKRREMGMKGDHANSPSYKSFTSRPPYGFQLPMLGVGSSHETFYISACFLYKTNVKFQSPSLLNRYLILFIMAHFKQLKIFRDFSEKNVDITNNNISVIFQIIQCLRFLMDGHFIISNLFLIKSLGIFSHYNDP